MKYCCNTFEEYAHKLSIGTSLDKKPTPFINLSVYTYGSIDLLEEEIVLINYCPFCGARLESEEQ